MTDDYADDRWVPAAASTPLTTAELEPAMSDEEREVRMATLQDDMTRLAELKARLPEEAREELARVNAEVWADWEASPA